MVTVGGFPFCCLSALPLAYFPAPYPPARARRAIFPGGEGGDFSFLMQGASPPCIPAPEPEAAQANPAEQIPSGGLPGWSPTNPAAVVSAGGVPSLLPADPAFSVLPCPHPPNPLPGGKGETKVISCKGLRPLHPRD